MFRFDFQLDTDSNQQDLNKTKKLKIDREPCEVSHDQPYGIYTYDQINSTRPEKKITFKPIYFSNESKIDLIDSSSVINDDELKKINETHDLVPGKYEGGLKVWELSVDLAKFVFNVPKFENLKGFKDQTIKDLTHIKKVLDKEELRVLELGCGHAAPSLSILKLAENKPKKVVFYLQDFNEQVVKDVTFENFKNFKDESKLDFESHFVYGDWSDLVKNKIIPTDYFDLILTSETIYNPLNYKHLLNIFQLCLKDSQSIVLLSAKTYYFGCGGNVHEFIEHANSSEYSLETTSNLLYEDLISGQHEDETEQTETKECIISKEIIKINKKN